MLNKRCILRNNTLLITRRCRPTMEDRRWKDVKRFECFSCFSGRKQRTDEWTNGRMDEWCWCWCWFRSVRVAPLVSRFEYFARCGTVLLWLLLLWCSPVPDVYRRHRSFGPSSESPCQKRRRSMRPHSS